MQTYDATTSCGMTLFHYFSSGVMWWLCHDLTRFFQGICCALSTKLVFLTDCSTSFDSVCVARLAYDLLLRKDLIGVTARQRVERPNPHFRPCEHTLIPFLKHKDEHKKPGSKPCWKCYLAYYLSPAPVQVSEERVILEVEVA